MAVEIEAKIKVADFEPIRTRLRAIGARLAAHYFEVNTFFDTPDGALVAADKGLRIRRNRNTDTGEEKLIITFKGPRQAGALKSREEHELEVSDYDDTLALFAALGYRATLTFEKRRESWSLPPCKIELDELPRLGKFMEVEGPSAEDVDAVLARLDTGKETLVKDGYATLLAKHLCAISSTETEIRFG